MLLARAPPPVVAAGLGAASANVPLRAADHARRAVALLAQLHRPDHPGATGRARGGRAVRPRGQVRSGHQRAGPRHPARLAAAGVLDSRRRGGPPRLLGDLHLVRRGARLRRSRAFGSSPAGSCGFWRRPTSSAPTGPSGCWRRASRSTRSTWRWSIVLGRTGRTEFSFPATIAATATNVVLNLALVPSLGIVGAGLALVASYLVVLVLMYVFTQRLFPVPYEWRRLALVVLSAAALVGAGEALLPTRGSSASRAGPCCGSPTRRSSTRSGFSTRRSARAWWRCSVPRRSPPGLAPCATPRRPRTPRAGPGRAPGWAPRSTRSPRRDEDRGGA